MKKPQIFGKYLLLERLNTGGMAEVFVAKSFGVEGFERILGIKKILPTMAEDEDFITMFIDEARISVQLNHANIVHIHELGKYDDTFYIAMEYVSGKDLRALLEVYRRKHEIMPTAQAVFIASKLAEGLDYAHSRRDMRGRPLGIIHRDVTPQNVLLSFDGEVKIIDFGIAKAANRSQRTQAGILKGKFGYMSPEQVLGLELDGRSDIFALGVILYEMLTGERLFVGESDFSTLERVRSAPVPAPRQFNPSIPPGLESVVMRSLARDPSERYQTGGEFQEDLMRFLLAGEHLYSARHLARCLHESFPEDVHREAERMARFADISRPDQIEDSGVVGFPAAPPRRSKPEPRSDRIRPAMQYEDVLTPMSNGGEGNTQIVLATGEQLGRRTEITDVKAVLPFDAPDEGAFPPGDVKVVEDALAGADEPAAGSPKLQVVIGKKAEMGGETRIGPAPSARPVVVPETVSGEQTRILPKPSRPGQDVPDPMAASVPLLDPEPPTIGAGSGMLLDVPDPAELSPPPPPPPHARPGAGQGAGAPLLPPLPVIKPGVSSVPMLTAVPLRQTFSTRLRRSGALRTAAVVLALLLLAGAVGGAALAFQARRAKTNVLITAVPEKVVEIVLGGQAIRNGEITAVRPGVYELVVTAPGYETQRTQLTVKKGQLVLRHEVVLVPLAGTPGAESGGALAPLDRKPAPGSGASAPPVVAPPSADRFTAVFTSEEPGVEVIVNGQRVGETPSARAEGLMRNKAYPFLARRAGFKPKQGEVRAVGTQPEVQVVVALEREPAGRMVVSSRPAGARVFVDGKDTGRETPVSAGEPLYVSPGKHRVVLRIGSKRSLPKDVEVAAGEAVRLSNVLIE